MKIRHDNAESAAEQTADQKHHCRRHACHVTEKQTQRAPIAVQQKTADDQLGTYEDSSNSRLDINTALQALNETERSIVTLYYLQDIPIKKITEITDLPEGTIKSHLSRARTKMAQVLKQ